MKDFPRPEPVKVKIFGREHELHRLTRSDVWNLAGALTDGLQDGLEALTGKGIPVAEAVKTALSGGGPALARLLEMSFPTFEEWEQMPVRHELALLEMVWDENDMAGIVDDFFDLAGKMAKSSKRIATLK